MPGPPTISGTEERRIFNPGIDRVRIGQRRLELPDALEFPWFLGVVIPLMRGERSAGFAGRVVEKHVALALRHAIWAHEIFWLGPRCVPGLTAIIRSLNHLPEPAACLRGIDAIRIHRRTLQVIHFPPGEVWSVHIPPLAFAIRRQDECALLGPSQ